MAELTVSNISKSYGIKEIFSEISFNIEEKDKIGIIGVNGAGKTTLFNILTGNIYPDEGDIHIRNGLKIGYLTQNIHIESEKTIYEECLDEFQYIFDMENKLEQLEKRMEQKSNSLLEIEKLTIEYNNVLEAYNDAGGYFYESKINGVLKGMGFPEERHNDVVNTLSGGEKSRLQLSKLMLSQPDILLLDEPTNHLDVDAIEFLEGFLNDFTGALLIISHDRYFLDRVVNRIFLLENKKLHVYNNNYTEFMSRRKKDLDLAARAYENQQKEIDRQKEIVERFANLGGSKRKRGIAQSRSRQKLLDKMETMDRPQEFDNKMKLIFKPKVESGIDVLQLESISKSFDNKELFSDLNFNIYKGEKVGLIGGNGTGKTSLFNIILNKVKADSGKISLGTGVIPVHFDQEQSSLDMENTIIDEIWDSYPDLTHYELRSYLAKFMFVGDDIFKLIDDLSGGEKARVSLLKLMLSSANFLLLDEPTNHLDIDSKEVLEDALNSYDGTAFIISHDRYFLNKVVDKIILLKDGSIELFHGNYDYYLEKINERKIRKPEEIGKTKTEIKKQAQKKKISDKQSRIERSQVRKLEKEIDEIQAKIHKLEEYSYKEEVYTDHQKALEIQKAIVDLKAKLEIKEESWLMLVE